MAPGRGLPREQGTPAQHPAFLLGSPGCTATARECRQLQERTKLASAKKKKEKNRQTQKGKKEKASEA